MKRKVLSVLSVLMAVILSTAVLAACEKTPAGAENSGEPSVSESAAESSENGELYEFAASEEAAAQVQSIAEVLGGYDFVGLSGVQST